VIGMADDSLELIDQQTMPLSFGYLEGCAPPVVLHGPLFPRPARAAALRCRLDPAEEACGALLLVVRPNCKTGGLMRQSAI
jgi:hypothetical protein